jgi:hypothetical protein
MFKLRTFHPLAPAVAQYRLILLGSMALKTPTAQKTQWKLQCHSQNVAREAEQVSRPTVRFELSSRQSTK